MSAPASSRDLSPLHAAVRDVPDFPKPGILFKDIMPLLADPACFKLAIDAFADICRALPDGPPTKIVGIDARGFIFGAALAYAMGLGVIPVRKKGKLPGPTEHYAYTLEYGEAVVEMQADALTTGDRVVLIDDLLATGGTAAAGVAAHRKTRRRTPRRALPDRTRISRGPRQAGAGARDHAAEVSVGCRFLTTD